MAEIEKLRAENAALRSAAGALDTLQNIYRDETVPRSERIKAAIASLQHEVPRLLPEKAPVDVSCEEIIPLPQLIEQRRARADAMEREMRDIEVLPNGTVRVLPKPGSNGSDN